MHKSLLAAALAAALIIPASAFAQQVPPREPVPSEPAPSIPAPTIPAPTVPAPTIPAPSAPAAAAQLDSSATAADAADVLEVARAAGTFTTLLRAIEVAGLTDTLSAAGPYTLFAPTDEAFARLPEGALDALLADPAALRELLLGHVLVSRVSAEEVQAQESALTATGAQVGVSKDGERLVVGGAAVVKRDIAASNGVIHAVDAVIQGGAGVKP